VAKVNERRFTASASQGDPYFASRNSNVHIGPFRSNALWAWKSFLRGHNPILYDLGIVAGVNPPDPSSGSPSFASLEAARYAMGDTRRFAERVQLSAMKPYGNLSSTGYVLASLGNEYLVLQPSETAEPFNVELADGTYTVKWHSITSRESVEASTLTVEGTTVVSLSTPFAAGGPAVVYLKCISITTRSCEPS